MKPPYPSPGAPGPAHRLAGAGPPARAAVPEPGTPLLIPIRSLTVGRLYSATTNAKPRAALTSYFGTGSPSAVWEQGPCSERCLSLAQNAPAGSEGGPPDLRSDRCRLILVLGRAGAATPRAHARAFRPDQWLPACAALLGGLTPGGYGHRHWGPGPRDRTGWWGEGDEARVPQGPRWSHQQQNSRTGESRVCV